MPCTSITHVRVYVYKNFDNKKKNPSLSLIDCAIHSRRFVDSLKEQTELMKMCKKLTFKFYLDLTIFCHGKYQCILSKNTFKNYESFCIKFYLLSILKYKLSLMFCSHFLNINKKQLPSRVNIEWLWLHVYVFNTPHIYKYNS